MIHNRNTVWLLTIAFLAALYGAIVAGGAIAHVDLPGNPILLAFAAGSWPLESWLLGGAVAVIGTILLALYARKQPASSAMGRLAARRPGQEAMLRRGRAAEARRLHADVDSFGVVIGRLSGSREYVYQGWRECSVHVWGPGRGKTMSQVVRHARDAPGPYVMTTCKSDGVFEVIAARLQQFPDSNIYVMDQEGVVGDGSPTMHFDLLATVTDSLSAERLAGIFETAEQEEGARGDSQFDQQGRMFFANCLLAAACSGRSVAQVHKWLSAIDFEEPAAVLHEHGHTGPAQALEGMREQPDKTRGSNGASAQRMAAALTHDRLRAWVEPGSARRFDAEAFVRSNDTLIMLSHEDGGAVRGYVSALVDSVVRAAERVASATNNGRLPLPLVVDLDECGNVVRLKNLPSWYSYFGSRGIVLNAYFQSPAQAHAGFGKEGFEALWSAAGMRVYGGGVDDYEWLRELASLFGTYEKKTQSTSRGRDGHVSRTAGTVTTDVVTAADLAALPPGKALVRSGLGTHALVDTLPVFEDSTFDSILERAATMKGWT